MSTPGIAPKYSLVFSRIRLEGYELDHNVDYIEEKNNWTTHPTLKLEGFAKVLWSSSNNGLMI